MNESIKDLYEQYKLAINESIRIGTEIHDNEAIPTKELRNNPEAIRLKSLEREIYGKLKKLERQISGILGSKYFRISENKIIVVDKEYGDIEEVEEYIE